MRYILENDTLKVEIDSHGAEVKSIRSKADDREYMWYADAKYWNRTSPVLFPFVGGLKNKEYHYKGKTYEMGQHGFARDMEHTVTEQTKDTIWFRLTETEETLKKYPFAFVLSIGYELKDNEVKVLWKVENPAETDLHFSIGAHPGFLCPIHGEESKEGYSLYFGGVEEIHHHGNSFETGLSMDEDIVLPLTDGKAVITPGFFDRCTYMVEGNQTGEVGLVDPSGKRYVTVYFDTPLFGIWSPECLNAPFVCIEPWYGRCDAEGFEGSLEEREYGNCLKAGEVFEASYVMKFE